MLDTRVATIVKEDDCYAKNELEILKEFKGHKNIPFLLTYAVAGGKCAMAMSRLEKAWRYVRSPTSWEQLGSFLVDILSALVALHENHIIHRDVKPDNVMYNVQRNTWVLIDFDASKRLKKGELCEEFRVGTRGFMAPEVRNREGYDEKVDLWSLGRTVLCLFELGFEEWSNNSRLHMERCRAKKSIGKLAFVVARLCYPLPKERKSAKELLAAVKWLLAHPEKQDFVHVRTKPLKQPVFSA